MGEEAMACTIFYGRGYTMFILLMAIILNKNYILVDMHILLSHKE